MEECELNWLQSGQRWEQVLHIHVNEPFGFAKHGAFQPQIDVINLQTGLPSVELHGFTRAKQRIFFWQSLFAPYFYNKKIFKYALVYI
jgi:hypothetical protein